MNLHEFLTLIGDLLRLLNAWRATPQETKQWLMDDVYPWLYWVFWVAAAIAVYYWTRKPPASDLFFLQ